MVQLDAVLGQASAVSSNLGEQRRLFENTGSKLMTLTAKFPLVNSVLNSIRKKKSKVGAPLAILLYAHFHAGRNSAIQSQWTTTALRPRLAAAVAAAVAAVE